MRNGIYTYYKVYHLEVNTIKDDNNRIVLNYKGDHSPIDNFTKSTHEGNVYFSIINLKDLTNSYYVKTYGKFKGFIFQIFDLKYTTENLIRIGTNDRDRFITATGLSENVKDWYIHDINASDLESIWEEREPFFNLPMPDGLNKIEKIK